MIGKPSIVSARSDTRTTHVCECRAVDSRIGVLREFGCGETNKVVLGGCDNRGMLGEKVCTTLVPVFHRDRLTGDLCHELKRLLALAKIGEV